MYHKQLPAPSCVPIHFCAFDSYSSVVNSMRMASLKDLSIHTMKDVERLSFKKLDGTNYSTWRFKVFAVSVLQKVFVAQKNHFALGKDFESAK